MVDINLQKLQAGGIAAVGLAGMAAFYPAGLLFALGLGLTGFAGYKVIEDMPKSNNKKIEEVLKALNYAGAKHGNLPVQVNKTKSDNHLVYELKPGMCPDDFKNLKPRLNSHLQAETDIYVNNSQLHIEVLNEKLPESFLYKRQEPPGDMILPIPIGKSRAGFLWADIVKMPHLAVAGETRGGKSNFLHQMIAQLLHNEKVKLHIVDLKKVEFGYLQDHAEIALTLPDTLKVLERLTLEMMYRMDMLMNNRKNNVVGLGLPYHVLIIDELSQLSPSLATDSKVKEMCKIAHQMLTSLICLSAALGIHIIASTQRPDREVLPGQLKANIPAALCFQVKNKKNSEIVLDNNNAASLPPVKGRGLWQFDGKEREVQVQHLPLGMAIGLLPNVAVTKPMEESVPVDGRI